MENNILILFLESVIVKHKILCDGNLFLFAFENRQDCAAINELCCRYYSKHTTRNQKNKLHFAVGDKVCCTKNAIVKDEGIHTEHKIEKRRAKHKPNIAESSLSVENSGLDDVQFGSTKDTTKKHQNEMASDTKHGKKIRRLCNGQIFYITAVCVLKNVT